MSGEEYYPNVSRPLISNPVSLEGQNFLRNGDVPKSLRRALVVFLSRRSIMLLILIEVLAGAWRAHLPWSPADACVVGAVVLWWVLQEWCLHALLLHSKSDWWGKAMHMSHHALPFHHVSIDGLEVIGPTLLAALGICSLLFKDISLRLTAVCSYIAMGLMYDWTHFIVHTKVQMRSYPARLIKRAHVKHHLRDDKYWFSFTCPPLDSLMGTTPDSYMP